MKTVLIVFLISLLPLCESSGFLTLKLTSDHDCLVHLEIASKEYSETVRLLAYETRSLEISVPGVTDQLSADFQILHHFSGDSLSEVSTQEFKLNNNGIWESRVIDSNKAILSIQSSFQCDNGFFGSVCERRSRNISPLPSSTTPEAAKTSPTKPLITRLKVSNDLIIYSFLALLVILLIIANILLCFCHPKKSKYIDDTFQNAPQIEETFTFQEDNTYEYLDAPSRFFISTAPETIV